MINTLSLFQVRVSKFAILLGDAIAFAIAFAMATLINVAVSPSQNVSVWFSTQDMQRYVAWSGLVFLGLMLFLMRFQHYSDRRPFWDELGDILRLMGAEIRVHERSEGGAEPVADLEVRASALKGIRVPEELVPLAIDEFPVLFIAAACAEGETLVTGAAELRVKESDRLAVMAEGLTRLGIVNELLPDGIRIQGGRFRPGRIDSHGDHRIAMAFAVASLACDGEIAIDDTENVGTSFPGFVDTARQAGLQVQVA